MDQETHKHGHPCPELLVALARLEELDKRADRNFALIGEGQRANSELMTRLEVWSRATDARVADITARMASEMGQLRKDVEVQLVALTKRLSEVEVAGWRQVYVVVAVILTAFAGLAVYVTQLLMQHTVATP